MKNRLMTAIVLIVGLVVGACGGESSAELDPEVADAVEQVESELDELTSEIDAVDQEELQGAWASVEDELSTAVDSLRAGETVDPDDIQQELSEFQQEIESADVADDLRRTWEELRAELEQLISNS